MKVLNLNDRCKQLIADNYNTGVVGCQMFVLSAKFRTLKLIIKKCNKDIFWRIHHKVTQATDEVKKIQSLIHNASYNDDLGLEEKCLLYKTFHMHE